MLIGYQISCIIAILFFIDFIYQEYKYNDDRYLVLIIIGYSILIAMSGWGAPIGLFLMGIGAFLQDRDELKEIINKYFNSLKEICKNIMNEVKKSNEKRKRKKWRKKRKGAIRVKKKWIKN